MGPDAVDARPGLLRALRDDNEYVARFALRTLEAIGHWEPDMVQPLLRGLENGFVRQGCAEAVVRIGEPAVQAVIGLLATEDPSLRAEAAWILGEIGPPALSSLPVLKAALQDGDPDVAWEAEEAIFKLTGESLPLPESLPLQSWPDGQPN
jgi:HEAT repeat protein